MQKWELLASPGHVLLTRVDEYRRKLRLPGLLFAGAMVMTFSAAPAALWIAKAGASSVEWVLRKGGGLMATPPAKSPAPALKRVQPVVPMGFSVGLETVPDFDADVLPSMKAQVAAANAGKRLEDCDFGRKIDAQWASVGDITPRCRYSKDGSRLWVWSIVKSKGQLRPWMGLIKREGKSAALFQIAIAGSPISEVDPSVLYLDHIPRTVAEDFPELVIATKRLEDLQ